MLLDETNQPIACRKCGSQQIIKSGMERKKQRYQCKNCGYYFTLKTKWELGHGKNDQKLVALMYIAGAGNNEIGRIFGRSYPVVRRYIEPIKKAVDSIAAIKQSRQPRKTRVWRTNSPDKVFANTKKRWLMIEIEDDTFDGDYIVISKD